MSLIEVENPLKTSKKDTLKVHLKHCKFKIDKIT